MTEPLNDRRQLLKVAALTPALAMIAGAARAATDTGDSLMVIAEIVAKPEHADDLRALLTPFAQATLKDAGCRHYTLYEDREVQGRFYTYEAWADEASLNAHLTSPAMKAAGPKLAALLAAPPVISKLRTLSAG